MLNGISGISGYNLYTNPYNHISNNTLSDSDKVNASGECQTCKNRKYQDGSNENVSFKAAAHISPEASAGTVRAHEGEHVANAYSKAAKENGKVINASVSIHTSVCPECGKTYVSGGTTNTTIQYKNEDNPYVKNLKAQQGEVLKGQYVDLAA